MGQPEVSTVLEKKPTYPGGKAWVPTGSRQINEPQQSSVWPAEDPSLHRCWSLRAFACAVTQTANQTNSRGNRRKRDCDLPRAPTEVETYFPFPFVLWLRTSTEMTGARAPTGAQRRGKPSGRTARPGTLSLSLTSRRQFN